MKKENENVGAIEAQTLYVARVCALRVRLAGRQARALNPRAPRAYHGLGIRLDPAARGFHLQGSSGQRLEPPFGKSGS
ncbi:MAG: hypothetical protein ACREYC_18935 [Gammaproteobacteria bacterium]